MDDQPENCRTCCCKSSENVEFFHPEAAPERECGASDDALYKVSLVPSISYVCHASYPYVDIAVFSDLFIVSHFGYFVFNKTVTEDTDIYTFIVDTDRVLPTLQDLLDYEIEHDLIHDYVLPDEEACEDRRRRTGVINVTPYMRYMTLVSILVSHSGTLSSISIS